MFLSSMCKVLARKSTPTVGGAFSSNTSYINLSIIEDFPTA